MQTEEAVLLNTSPTGEWSFTTILHWEHHRGRPAHCLARAYRAAAARPVVVLSEISSNPDGRGISDDIPAVAMALLDVLPPECRVDPAEVTWLAHHGEFSYPDALDAPEVFTLVPLEWTGSGYEDNLARHRRLRGEELRATLGTIQLAPVPAVLQQLRRR